MTSVVPKLRRALKTSAPSLATERDLWEAGDRVIVGVDEVRHDEGEVSWVSPIARALLKAEEGDFVKVRTPQGNEVIEVIEISYPGG